jgi:hypothetical protein
MRKAVGLDAASARLDIRLPADPKVQRDSAATRAGEAKSPMPSDVPRLVKPSWRWRCAEFESRGSLRQAATPLDGPVETLFGMGATGLQHDTGFSRRIVG